MATGKLFTFPVVSSSGGLVMGVWDEKDWDNLYPSWIG